MLTQEKLNSVDDSFYIFAPYTLILPNGKFGTLGKIPKDNSDQPGLLEKEVMVDYIHLDHTIPTPESTQDRNSNSVTGVDKLWVNALPCAPWFMEFPSGTGKDYWKSEYMIVIQLERPDINKTVSDTWAERVAGAEDIDIDSEKLPPDPIPPHLANEDIENTLDATDKSKLSVLGATPEERAFTAHAAKAKGLLTLLKYYDKEFDLVSVLRLAKLPWLVREYSTYVDPDLPGAPFKVLIGVPMRFFDAIPTRQVPFQFEYESRLDLYIDEGLLIKKDDIELAELDELMDKRGTVDAGRDGIGTSIYKTFNDGKDLDEEISKVYDRITENAHDVLALENPLFEGQRVYFSSTFYISKLERDLKKLKRILKKYDKKISLN